MLDKREPENKYGITHETCPHCGGFGLDHGICMLCGKSKFLPAWAYTDEDEDEWFGRTGDEEEEDGSEEEDL
jgi:ribosomal protein L32